MLAGLSLCDHIDQCRQSIHSTPIHDKSCQKNRNRGNFLIKNLSKDHIIDIMLNGEKLNASPQSLETRQECLPSPLLFHIQPTQ